MPPVRSSSVPSSPRHSTAAEVALPPEGATLTTEGVAVLVAATDGSVRQVGGAVGPLLGQAPDLLVGRTVTEVLAAPEADVLGAVAQVVAGHGDAQVLVRVTDAMGLERPLRASLCLVSGAPDLLVVTLAPAAGPATLPVGFDPARTLVTVSEASSAITRVSDGATALLGWAPDEVAQRGARGLVHPADLERFTAEGRRVIRTPGAVGTIRVRVWAADGHPRWVRVVGMNRFEDPGVRGLVTCVTDATDEVRRELRAEEARLAAAGLLRSATIEVSALGSVGFATEAGAHILGARPEALVALDLPAHLSETDGPVLLAALGDVAEDGRRTRSVDVTLSTDDRGDRRVRMAVRGRPEGEDGHELLVDLVDITEKVHALEAVRASERRFRTLVQSSTDIVAVLSLDLRIRWVSPAVTATLGYSPDALVGLPATSIVHADDLAFARDEGERERAQDHTQLFSSVRIRARHANGGWRHLSLSGTDLSGDPDVGGLLFSARDITPEVEAERGRERLAQVLEASTDLVVIARAGTDRIELNGAARLVLGVDGPTTSSAAVEARTPPWAQRRMLGEVVPSLEASGTWEGELALYDHDGDVVPLSVVAIALHDPDGLIETIACVARDISDRKAFEDQLEHQATHDPLSGLPNRTLLLDRLRVAIGRAGRQSTMTAVLFLDLDNFKLINDSLGHSAGDQLLVQVARRIEGAVRPGDTVARFGGDEFAVLCEDLADRDEAITIATRIEHAVGQPMELDGTEVMVTVSIGVSTSDGTQEAESLVRDSDAAMYQAKARGRSRTEVFDRDMHVQAIDRLELETALRRAVDRHEMRVAFQPQIDLRTGRINGVEALVRWEHPERGLLLPGEFLHIAEETGLIVAIGNWITSAACRATARLHDLHPAAADIVMSVNLSARQLASPRLLDDVAAILSAAELPPHALMLEITESVLMDVDASGQALTGLHELGVAIAVDDFGTGWSSLRYLRDFPVDVLKVDQSFVAGLGRDPEDEAIVAAVIDLAHALGLSAVAEGVEDATRLDRLEDLGCDSAQGWLLGRPMAEADLLELVRAQGTPAE